MNERDRLDHLRRLLDRLERMPPAADRDWMLAEVRRRMVDVETGIPPAETRARPRDELEAEIAAERSPRLAPVKAQTRKPSRRPQGAGVIGPAVRMAPVAMRERSREEVVDLLQQGDVMCLDEGAGAATGATRPWASGLRG